MGFLSKEEFELLNPDPNDKQLKSYAPIDEVFGVIPKAVKGTIASLGSYIASGFQDKEKETTALPEKEELDWKSKWQKAAADIHKSIAEDVSKNPYMKYEVPGLWGMTLGDIAMMGPSLAPSAASIGVGYGGAKIGGAIGSLAGPKGAAVGAVVGSIAATTGALDKAISTQTLYDSLVNAREYLSQRGIPYTKEIEDELKKTFIEKATEVGKWESIPEAVGATLELALVGGLGRKIPILKHAAKLRTAEDFGKAALTARALEIAKRAGKTLGMLGATELSTEVITEIGEKPAQYELGLLPQYDQSKIFSEKLAPLGILITPTEEEKQKPEFKAPSFTNLNDILEATKEVWGPTLITAGLIGAGAAGVKKVANVYDKYKTSVVASDIQNQIASIAQTGSDEIFRAALLNTNKEDFISNATFLVANDEEFRKNLAQTLTLQNAENPRTPESLTTDEIAAAIAPRLEAIWNFSKSPLIDRVDLVNYFLDDKGSLADLASPANKEIIRQSISKDSLSFSELWKEAQRVVEGLSPYKVEVLRNVLTQSETTDPDLRIETNKKVRDYIKSQVKSGNLTKEEGLTFEAIYRFLPAAVKTYLQNPGVLERVVSPNHPQDTLLSSFENVVKSQVETRVQNTFNKVLEQRTHPPETAVVFRKFEETLKKDPATKEELEQRLADPSSYISNIEELLSKNPSQFSSWDKVFQIDSSAPSEVYRESYLKLPETVKFVNRMLNTPSILWTPRDFSILQKGNKEILPLTEEALNAVKENATLLSYSIYKSYQAPIEYYNKINSEIKSIPNLRTLLSQTARESIGDTSILPYHKWSEEDRSQALELYTKGQLPQEKIRELGIAVNKSLGENRMNIRFTPKSIYLPDGTEIPISTPDFSKISILGKRAAPRPELTAIERLKSFSDIVVSLPDSPSREALSNVKDLDFTLTRVKAFLDLVNDIPDADNHIVDLPVLKQKAEKWINYLGMMDDRYKQSQPIELFIKNRIQNKTLSPEDVDFISWTVSEKNPNKQENKDAILKSLEEVTKSAIETAPSDIDDFLNRLEILYHVRDIGEVVSIPDLTATITSFSEPFVKAKLLPLIATYQAAALRLAKADPTSSGVIDKVTRLSTPAAKNFYENYKTLIEKAALIPDSIQLTDSMTVRDYLNAVRGQAISEVSIPGDPIVNDKEVLKIVAEVLGSGKVTKTKRLTISKSVEEIANSLKTTLEGVDFIDDQGLTKIKSLVEATVTSLRDIGNTGLADTLQSLYQAKVDNLNPPQPEQLEPTEQPEQVTQPEPTEQPEQVTQPIRIVEDPQEMAARIIHTAADKAKNPTRTVSKPFIQEEAKRGPSLGEINTFPPELLVYTNKGILDFEKLDSVNPYVAIGVVRRGRQGTRFTYKLQPLNEVKFKKSSPSPEFFIIKESEEKNTYLLYPLNLNSPHLSVFDMVQEGTGRLILEKPAQVNKFGVITEKGLVKRARSAEVLSDNDNLNIGLARLGKLFDQYGKWLESGVRTEKSYASLLTRYIGEYHTLLSQIYHEAQRSNDPRGEVVKGLLSLAGLDVSEVSNPKPLSEVVSELVDFLNKAINIPTATVITIQRYNLGEERRRSRSPEEKKARREALKANLPEQAKVEDLSLYDPTTPLDDNTFRDRLERVSSLLYRIDINSFEKGAKILVDAASYYLGTDKPDTNRTVLLLDTIAKFMGRLDTTTTGDVLRWKTLTKLLEDAKIEQAVYEIAEKNNYILSAPRKGEYFDIDYVKRLIYPYKAALEAGRDVRLGRRALGILNAQISLLSYDIKNREIEPTVMSDVVELLESVNIDPRSLPAYREYLEDLQSEEGIGGLSSGVSLNVENITKTSIGHFVASKNNFSHYIRSLHNVYKYIWNKVRDFLIYLWDVLSSPVGKVLVQRDFSSQFSLNNGPQQLSYKIFPLLNADLTVSDTFIGRQVILNSSQAAGVFRELFKGITKEESIVLITDKINGQIYEAQRYSLNEDDASAIPLDLIAGRAYNYAQKLDRQVVVWVAHNHPSGIPYRTASDIQQDDRIIELLLDLEGVSFGDSIIITDTAWSSYSHPNPNRYQDVLLTNVKDDPDLVYRIATAGDRAFLSPDEGIDLTRQEVLSTRSQEQIQDHFKKLKDELDGLTASWESKGAHISLLSSVMDPQLPPHVLQALQRREVVDQTSAVYDNGRVYLFADKIESREHLEQLLLHEWFGHEGLRRLNLDLAELYTQLTSDQALLDDLISKYQVPYNQLVSSIRRDKALSEQTQNALIAEEILAHIQQSGQLDTVSGLIKQFIGKIREWLRQLGFSFVSNLSESDLFYTLRRARLAAESAHIMKEYFGENLFVSTGTKPARKSQKSPAPAPDKMPPELFAHPELKLKKVSNTQWGSAAGGLYITPDKQKYYVRFYRTDDQVRTEFASLQVYKLLGVEIPDVHIQYVPDSTGKPRLAFVSKITPNLKFAPQWGDPIYFKGLERAYVASVITKNWDVIPGDIAVTAKDEVLLIDAGGSVTFRAQGAPTDFVRDINELYSFQELGRSQRRVFKGTPSRLKSSSVINDLINLTDDKLEWALRSAGFDDSNVSAHLEILKGRRDLLIAELLSQSLESSAVSEAFGVLKVLHELKKNDKLNLKPTFKPAYQKLLDLFKRYTPTSVKDKDKFLEQELEQTSLSRETKVSAFAVTDESWSIKDVLLGRMELPDSAITFNLAGLPETTEGEVRRVATSIIQSGQDLKTFSETFQKANPSLFQSVSNKIRSVFDYAKRWYREKSSQGLLRQELQPADKTITLGFAGLQTFFDYHNLLDKVTVMIRSWGIPQSDVIVTSPDNKIGIPTDIKNQIPLDQLKSAYGVLYGGKVYLIPENLVYIPSDELRGVLFPTWFKYQGLPVISKQLAKQASKLGAFKLLQAGKAVGLDVSKIREQLREYGISKEYVDSYILSELITKYDLNSLPKDVSRAGKSILTSLKSLLDNAGFQAFPLNLPSMQGILKGLISITNAQGINHISGEVYDSALHTQPYLIQPRTIPQSESVTETVQPMTLPTTDEVILKVISLLPGGSRIVGKYTANELRERARNAVEDWGLDSQATVGYEGLHELEITNGQIISVIYVASDAKNIPLTLFHEAYHATKHMMKEIARLTNDTQILEDLGYLDRFLDSLDFTAMKKHEREKYFKKYPVLRTLYEATGGRLTLSASEHQAIAFSYYAAGRIEPSSLPKLVRKVFDAIKLFFANLSSYLRGYGFTSPEQIFNTIYSGKIKAQYEEAVRTKKPTIPPTITSPQASLMAETPMERTNVVMEKDRMFVHSLDPIKIIESRGVLPPSSIAVVPKNNPFVAGFGRICLFGDPDKFKPEANPDVAEYYPTDMYGPSIGQATGEFGALSPERILQFLDFVRSTEPTLDRFISQHLENHYKNLATQLKSSKLTDGEIFSLLKSNPVTTLLVGYINDAFPSDENGYLDEDITLDIVRNPSRLVLSTDYETEVKNLFGQVAGLPYLYDPINGRSFLGTHENLLTYMRQFPVKFGEPMRSLEDLRDLEISGAEIRVLLARKLKTLQDIKTIPFPIQDILDFGEPPLSTLIQTLWDIFYSHERLQEEFKGDFQGYLNTVLGDVLLDYVRSGDLASSLQEIANVTPEMAKQLEKALLKAVFSFDEYLEGKLFRPIPLTDFKFAIVFEPDIQNFRDAWPTRMQLQLKYALKILRDNNVPYYFKHDLSPERIQELVDIYNVAFSLADLKGKNRKVVDKDLLTYFVLTLLPTGSVIRFNKTSSQLARSLTGITDWSPEALATANIAGVHQARITNGQIQSVINIASDVDDITLHTFHEAFHSIQTMLREIARIKGDAKTLQMLDQLAKEFPDVDFSKLTKQQREDYFKKYPILMDLYERSGGRLSLSSSEHQAIAFSYYASERYRRVVEGGFSNQAKEFFDSIIEYLRRVISAILNVSYTPSKYLFNDAFTGKVRERYEEVVKTQDLSLPYNPIFDRIKAPQLSMTTKKDLIITHSTIPHKIIYNRGNLVGISTAVTTLDKPDAAHFGPIFLFGKPDKLGPGPKQKYYAADIYSPVIPERSNVPVRVYPDRFKDNLTSIIQEHPGLQKFLNQYFKKSLAKITSTVETYETDPKLASKELAKNPVIQVISLLDANRISWDDIKNEKPSEILAILKEEISYYDMDTISGWVDTNLIEPSSVDSFIDPFTNQRVEATPENILRIFDQAPLKLGEGDYTLNNIFNKATKVNLKTWLAKNLPDLETIKANKYLIDYSRKNDLYHWSPTVSTQLRALSQYVRPGIFPGDPRGAWSTVFHQTLGKYIELAYKVYGMDNDVLDYRLFSQALDTFYNAPEQLKQQLYTTLLHEMSAPVPYFEGKILREVPLSDFAFAVVPKNLSESYTEFESKFIERIFKREKLPYYKVDMTETEKIKELVNRYDVAFSLAAFSEKPQTITDIDLLIMDILRIISEGSSIDFSRPSKELLDSQATVAGWKYSNMLGARVAGLIKTRITNGHVQSIIKVASDAPNKTLHAFHEAFHAIQIMLMELDRIYGIANNQYAQKLKALQAEFPELDFSRMSEEERTKYTTRYPILKDLVEKSKGRLIISSSEHQAIAFGYYASAKYQAKMAKTISATARGIFDKAIRILKEISSRILGRPMPAENVLFDDLYGEVDLSSVAKEIFEEAYSGRIKEQYENVFKTPAFRQQARLSRARVITHTLSAENLKKVEEMDGFLVNPSVAVTVATDGGLRFLGNEILLVGDYQTLGPEAHKYHTYGSRDLYSPTMSHVAEPTMMYYSPGSQKEIMSALRKWMESLGISDDDIKNIRLSPKTDQLHKVFRADDLTFLYVIGTKQTDKYGDTLKDFHSKPTKPKFKVVLDWFYSLPEIRQINETYKPIRYTTIYSKKEGREREFPYTPQVLSEYLARFRESHPKMEPMKSSKLPPAWKYVENTLSRYATEIKNREDLDDWTRSLLSQQSGDQVRYTKELTFYADQLANYARTSTKPPHQLLLTALKKADEYRDVRSGFEDVYGKEVPDDLIARAVMTALNIHKSPDALYLEGKLERPVKLSEFKVALVLDDLRPDIKKFVEDTLKKYGLKVHYYKRDAVTPEGNILKLSNELLKSLDNYGLLFSYTSSWEALHNTNTPFVEEVRYHPQAMLFIAPQLETPASRLNLEGKPISILATDTLEFKPNAFTQKTDGTIVADRDKKDPNGRLTLRELIDFPQLFNLYPTLGDVKVKVVISDSISSPYGWATDSAIYVQATNEDEAKEVLIHELQHVLDGINGFASGGSPKNSFIKTLAEHSYNFYHNFKKKVVSGLDDQSLKTDLEVFLEYQEMEDEVRKAFKKDKGAPVTPAEMKKYLAFRWYQRLLGEVMAREAARHPREPQNDVSTTEFFLNEETKKWININFEEAVAQGLGFIEDLESINPADIPPPGERAPVSDVVKDRVVSDVTRKLDAHYLTKKTFRDKLNEWVEAAKNAWHHLTRLVPSIDPIKYPIVNDIFRRALNVPGTAAEEAMRMVQAVVGGLSESQHQTLSYYLVARQLLARMRAATDPASLSLPFNKMPFDATFDIDKLVAEIKASDPSIVIDLQDPLKWVLEHLERKIRKDPKLQEALAKRRKLLYDFKVRMVENGLLDPKYIQYDPNASSPLEPNLSEDYFHAIVSQYADKVSLYKVAKTMRLGPKLISQRDRYAGRDFITNYAVSEYHFLYENIVRMNQIKLINEFKTEADILPYAQQQFEKLYLGAARQIVIERYLPEIQAEADQLWADGAFAEEAQNRGVLESVIRQEYMESRINARARKILTSQLYKDKFSDFLKKVYPDYEYVDLEKYQKLVMGYGITSREYQKQMEESLRGVGVKFTLEDLKPMKVLGGPQNPVLIHKSLAEALRYFEREVNKTRGVVSDLLFRINLWTKKWILMSPFRVLKWTLNNISGDIDAAFFIEVDFRKYARGKITKTFKDLKAFSLASERDKLPPETIKLIEEAMELRAIHSGLYMNEFDDIREIALDKPFVGKSFAKSVLGAIKDFAKTVKEDPLSAPGRLASNYIAVLEPILQARENTLRLLAYQFYIEEITKFLDQVKKHYPNISIADIPNEAFNKFTFKFGASDKREIIYMVRHGYPIKNIAAKLAAELLGDYGAVSPVNKFLAQYVMPFHRFTAMNFNRYLTIYKNLWVDPEWASSYLGRRLLRLAVMAPLVTLKVSVLIALITLFNILLFPKEWEELYETHVVKGRLPLILGRNSDGTIRTLRIEGAFTQFLKWFNLDSYMFKGASLLKGELDWKTELEDAAKSPLNMLSQGLMPVVKSPVEAFIIERSTFPDLFNPRPIRDKGEHLSKLLAAEGIWNFITGKPQDPTAKWSRLFTMVAAYQVDPYEAAYFESKRMAEKFLDNLGINKPETLPSGRGNNLYFFKKALKVGDRDAALKYLTKYIEDGGEISSIAQSIKQEHPLASVPIKYRKLFINSLNPREQEILKLAQDWYKKVYTTEPKLSREDISRIYRQARELGQPVFRAKLEELKKKANEKVMRDENVFIN